MPQNQDKDRRHQDNLSPEKRSEIGRKGGEARSQESRKGEGQQSEGQTAQNKGSEKRRETPAANQAEERRSGGQGEVRSDKDRRLEDNLDPEKRSEIGRKGGEAVSQDREHMAEIGQKGGRA